MLLPTPLNFFFYIKSYQVCIESPFFQVGRFLLLLVFFCCFVVRLFFKLKFVFCVCVLLMYCVVCVDVGCLSQVHVHFTMCMHHVEWETSLSLTVSFTQMDDFFFSVKASLPLFLNPFNLCLLLSFVLCNEKS